MGGLEGKKKPPCEEIATLHPGKTKKVEVRSNLLEDKRDMDETKRIRERRDACLHIEARFYAGGKAGTEEREGEHQACVLLQPETPNDHLQEEGKTHLGIGVHGKQKCGKGRWLIERMRFILLAKLKKCWKGPVLG